MSYNRRDFLKKAMAGATVTGLGGLGIFEAKAHPNNGKPGIEVLPQTNEAERRKLVDEAHFGPKTKAVSQKGMAICSHPLATRTGANILKSGGNACDAALAMSVCQTVVEPHMTGITGILSMLYYDASTGKTTYVNGNMNAPLTPLVGFDSNALASGLGAGVPGFWGGFEAALEKHGSKPRKEIMVDAIRYAREGFETHPFLWGEMFVQCAMIGKTAEGREIFMPNNYLPKPGEMLYQKRAADTLEQLAEKGNDFFYRGKFAEDYCQTVQDAGGVITMKDMEAYEARWMEPAWGTYHGYKIAASPPPDNGGTHIIEALNMLEFLDVRKYGPPTDSAEVLAQMVRIHNEVYTFGAKHPDPKSHPLPLDVILSKEYAEARFKLLQMGVPKEIPENPPPVGSNHVTVVDGAGNVATIIHSCMSLPWSNGLFTHGVTIVASGAHFFRIMPKPGHRATTYVAPNIVFKNGKPILSSGSPSVGLLANIMQNTINILDFGIPIDESVNRPRFGGSYYVPGNMVEADFNPNVVAEAGKKGILLTTVNPWNWHLGAFEGIYIDQNSSTMIARGDPRRCSKAEGI